MIIGENATIEEVREMFKNDKFATKVTGCTIEEAAKGYSKCKLELTPDHFNAAGGVMGGAIFTLADLAFAVASNVGEELSVGVSNNIEFLQASKGETLIAECHVERSGRSTGFYTCTVTDDTGKKIAIMTGVCHR